MDESESPWSHLSCAYAFERAKAELVASGVTRPGALARLEALYRTYDRRGDIGGAEVLTHDVVLGWIEQSLREGEREGLPGR